MAEKKDDKKNDKRGFGKGRKDQRRGPKNEIDEW
jgi:hypothetical protein